MGWKIAICDDDAGQAARLQADVTDWAHGACAVTCFPSAEAFRFAGDTDWDILLLDVEMPGMSGIDLAKRLRGAGCRAEIIFITSHFECMAEGYEVDALHYLVKPVPAEKLRAVLDRAAARLAVEPPSVVIACEEGNVKLYESELLYAESFLHDLVLHTTGPDYRIRESISAFAGRLSADFFRTHRSYLVNLKAVVNLHGLYPGRVHGLILVLRHRVQLGQFHLESHGQVGVLAHDAAVLHREKGEPAFQRFRL